MKSIREMSTIIGATALLAALISPTASAVENNSAATWVWSRSADAPALLAIGSVYKVDRRSADLPEKVQSKDFAYPEAPTPEREERAIERSGARYIANGSPEVKLQAAGVPDFAACNANPEGHAPSSAGFIKNHFEFCRWGFNTLTKLSSNGAVEGQVTFKETEVGEGSNERRIGAIHVKVSDLSVTGVFTGAAMTLAPSATGFPSTCTTKFSTSDRYQAPLATWNGTQLTYEVTGPKASGDQKRIDKPVTCNFRSNYRVDGVRGASDWYRGPDQAMRMDSADYLKVFDRGGEGAIFSRVRPWFSYDYNDASVRQVAEHIFSAYMNPASTEPRVDPAKNIPGWRGGTSTLTRNFRDFDADSGKVAEANESAKNAACRKMTKGNSSYQCDEFPFASTKEGAGSGENFSVRYVPASANLSAGGKLSAWYAQDRILDGDKFQVHIENHGKIIPGSLISNHSKKALDVAGWAPGAPVQIWDFWGGPNQDVTFNDDHELRIFGNHCLDGGTGAAGTQVTSQPCSGAESQKWVGGVNIPTSAPMVFHVASGLCLDVKGWGTANSTPITLYDCHDGDNQRWTVHD
ncbi:ricin-type beta-trefoil lectin domain protein [Streptomyces virginiae]|uniref:ricin-type beta-trefoil lectin domain protein n=1 Tax=Streptomyces virginiae TaxID=1961 RepID=UPI003429E65D